MAFAKCYCFTADFTNFLLNIMPIFCLFTTVKNGTKITDLMDFVVKMKNYRLYGFDQTQETLKLDTAL